MFEELSEILKFLLKIWEVVVNLLNELTVDMRGMPGMPVWPTKLYCIKGTAEARPAAVAGTLAAKNKTSMHVALSQNAPKIT